LNKGDLQVLLLFFSAEVMRAFASPFANEVSGKGRKRSTLTMMMMMMMRKN
jgi:hypothetical protein